MPVYEFRCPNCAMEGQCMRSLGDTRPPACPNCAHDMKRRYSPPAIKVYQPHLTSDGVEVTSDRAHADHLKRLSEEKERRTGIPTNFIPVHPADQRDVYGITEEGMDTTYRREVAEGKREVKMWL